MGAAPKILEETRPADGWARETDREWFLDTVTGELKPEADSGQSPLDRPAPVRVARRTYD